MTTTVTRAAAAVTLRGISRVYGRGAAAVRAVDGVSLEFPRGGWTAVMGPSGSGKSTLLHCAAGLERVDSGQVLIGETDLTGARDEQLTALRRTRIGFVFQSFHLIGSLTAEQNVALPLRLAGEAAFAGGCARHSGCRRARGSGTAPASGAVRRAAAKGGDRAGDGDPAGRAVRR